MATIEATVTLTKTPFEILSEHFGAYAAVIEAAKLNNKLADAIECGEDVTDVQLQDAVGQLRQAVRALAELEEK